ncbi:MAG: CAP domain-containing protein [Anaeromyxobacter sp.]
MRGTRAALPQPGPARAWAAALLAALAGCLSHPPAAPAEPALLPASVQAGRAPPPAAAAPADYGRDPEVELAPVEKAALDALRAAPGGAALRMSGALVRAARELAARAARGERSALDPAALRGALARGQSYDPGPEIYLVSGAASGIPDALTRLVSGGPATHLGVGAVEQDGRVVAVLLKADRRVLLDPFPRAVAPGGSARLAGRLHRELVHPRAFLTLPSGQARELEVRGTGQAFQAQVQLPAQGRYLLEVVAEGAAGPEVTALLVISAGGAALDAPGPAPAADPASLEAAEAAVLRALNATRSRQRLPPLRADPAVAAVARRHAEAMRAAGLVAHVLPGSPGPDARLRAAGLPFAAVRENVAQARTALQAHATIEESPAHLANLLDPQLTRAGVGVARGQLPNGDPTTYLCEVLLRAPDEARRGSRLTPAARVREALWAERARLGLPPLTADLELDALADEAAARLLASDGEDDGGAARRALDLPRALAAVDRFVVESPTDAVRSANLRQPGLRRVGVGVREGDSRRLGRGRLFISVVYSD